ATPPRPGASVEVVSAATPPAPSACGAPKSAPSILNCTEPVGVPAADVTVALKVTFWPGVRGPAGAEMESAVAAFATLNETLAGVAALKLASPACEALTKTTPA